MRFCIAFILMLVPVCCLGQPLERSHEADALSQDVAIVQMLESNGARLDEAELSRFKPQVLQSIAISVGRLHDLGKSTLSSTHLDVSIGTGIPLGSMDNILGVKPRARIDWIDAAAGIEVPEELYQFELQLFYRRPINERLSAIAVVSPSIRSDLTTSENALRVFALGILNWEYIPDRLTLSVGAVYLGRADLPVLPAAGLTWRPNRETIFDLQFPRPKFARRLAKNGSQSETWCYISTGLGGGTWGVSRNAALNDELSLSDLRLLFGVEKIVDGGGGWFAEAGYAFHRRLEYESDDLRIHLGDAAVLHAGWRY